MGKALIKVHEKKYHREFNSTSKDTINFLDTKILIAFILK